MGRHGRAHRRRPYQPPSNPSSGNHFLCLSVGGASSGNLMTRAIGEMVGAAPVCPPERPRSGVSMPKIHPLCAGMNDGCALAGRHGRAHRHRPYHFSCGSVSQGCRRGARRWTKTRKVTWQRGLMEVGRGGAYVPDRVALQGRINWRNAQTCFDVSMHRL